MTDTVNPTHREELAQKIQGRARETHWVCEDCGAEQTLTRYDDFPSVTVDIPRHYPNVTIHEKERPLCNKCGSLNYVTDDWMPEDSKLTDRDTVFAIKSGDINRFSLCPGCHQKLTHTRTNRYCSDLDCDGIGSGNDISDERRFILGLEKYWHENVDKRFKAFVNDVRREYPELFTPEATPVRLE